MHGLIGILYLDDCHTRLKPISAAAFSSPLWTPDHQGVYEDEYFSASITQRFVTPQCSNFRMPWHDLNSGCVIIADAYLSNHRALCDILDKPSHTADAELILSAYLRWGEGCCQYLNGAFCFAIWNVKQHSLFLATDHFNQHPLLYSHRRGHYILFANHLSGLRTLLGRLTWNSDTLARFVLDADLSTYTAYQEVERLAPAHYATVQNGKLRKKRYWRLQKSPQATQKNYLEQFENLFSEVMSGYLRTNYTPTSHISGGLDSSSISAMAAKLLEKDNRSLRGFSAIPFGLNGDSQKSGWRYHELPLVEDLCRLYPNIQLHVHTTQIEHDIFDTLRPFFHLIDQPIRNVFNFGWMIACLQEMHRTNSRLLLIGQSGNGTISWSGQRWLQKLRAWQKVIWSMLNPLANVEDTDVFYQNSFLNQSETQCFINARGAILNKHHYMLMQRHIVPRISSFYPITLWYGVEQLDPTADVRLVEFCYHVPQWVYRVGRKPLEKRLLVREGLKSILPPSIAQNPYRGHQSADVFLQYNQHHAKWFERLYEWAVNHDLKLLWKFYDPRSILSFFRDNPEITPQMFAECDSNSVISRLAICLSMGFFLEDSSTR